MLLPYHCIQNGLLILCGFHKYLGYWAAITTGAEDLVQQCYNFGIFVTHFLSILPQYSFGAAAYHLSSSF